MYFVTRADPGLALDFARPLRAIQRTCPSLTARNGGRILGLGDGTAKSSCEPTDLVDY